MRRIFRFLFTLITIILVSFNAVDRVSAQDSDDPSQPSFQETYEGMPICAPGVYLVDPIDCLLVGPSQQLSMWASEGLSLPLKPLIARNPDYAYTQVDRSFAKLNLLPGAQAAFYPNIAAAEARSGALSMLPIGETLYVSYQNVAYLNGNPYVANERDEWIRASPTTYSDFQGLFFERPVVNNFGWTVDRVQPRREPSVLAPVVNETLAQQTVVQIYEQMEAEGTTWYMIGFGKWVERRYIRVIYPQLSAPEGVENGRWIEVNLYEQTLTVYEENRLIFATLIGSGYEPYYTQPGLFQIDEMKEYETMTGAFATGKTDFYLLEDVPWTMYYDGPRALHGAYWRQRYGYELSHGCVNLSVGDAAWLYEWANVGDWVYVWDPSGLTPTDPEFYKEGVAF